MKTAANTAVALAVMGGVACAHDGRENNYYLGCKEVTAGRGSNHGAQGMCIGAVRALGGLYGPNFICVPPDVTTRQVAGVVVKFMDGARTESDDTFMTMAVTAMQLAWPCKR
jgi:hypothetical protein